MRLIIKDVKHWHRKKDFLNFIVLTLATVILWVGFEIYHTYSQSSIEEEVQSYLEPLNPSLDQETIQSLQNRTTIPESIIYSPPSPSASPSASPLPSALPTTASPSATPEI